MSNADKPITHDQAEEEEKYASSSAAADGSHVAVASGTKRPAPPTAAAAAVAVAPAVEDSQPAAASPPSAAKKRRKSAGPVIPRRKKPKDMPRRPLSAYNLFFREEREKILATYRQGEDQDDFEVEDMEVTTQQESKQFNAKLFQAVARTIANRWKSMDQEGRKVYENRASAEMVKYRKAVEEYEKKMVENSTIGKKRQTAVEDASRHELEAGMDSGSSSGARRRSAAAGSLPPSVAVATASQPAQMPPLMLPHHATMFYPASLGTDPLLGDRGASSMGNMSPDLAMLLQQQRQQEQQQQFGQSGMPLTLGMGWGQQQQQQEQQAFSDRLVLSSRNALLDAFTLRQLQEQQLRRRAALSQELFLRQQQHQQHQQQPPTQENINALFQSAPHYPSPAGGLEWQRQTPLLDQVLREQRQQQESLLGPGFAHARAATAATPGVSGMPDILSVRRVSAAGHPGTWTAARAGATAAESGTEGNSRTQRAGVHDSDLMGMLRRMEEDKRRRRDQGY